jgi:hypothetical protein
VTSELGEKGRFISSLCPAGECDSGIAELQLGIGCYGKEALGAQEAELELGDPGLETRRFFWSGL